MSYTLGICYCEKVAKIFSFLTLRKKERISSFLLEALLERATQRFGPGPSLSPWASGCPAASRGLVALQGPACRRSGSPAAPTAAAARWQQRALEARAGRPQASAVLSEVACGVRSLPPLLSASAPSV